MGRQLRTHPLGREPGAAIPRPRAGSSASGCHRRRSCRWSRRSRAQAPASAASSVGPRAVAAGPPTTRPAPPPKVVVKSVHHVVYVDQWGRPIAPASLPKGLTTVPAATQPAAGTGPKNPTGAGSSGWPAPSHPPGAGHARAVVGRRRVREPEYPRRPHPPRPRPHLRRRLRNRTRDRRRPRRTSAPVRPRPRPPMRRRRSSPRLRRPRRRRAPDPSARDRRTDGRSARLAGERAGQRAGNAPGDAYWVERRARRDGKRSARGRRRRARRRSRLDVHSRSWNGSNSVGAASDPNELVRVNARAGEWTGVSGSMLLALTCAADLHRTTAGRVRSHDPRRARTGRLRPHVRAVAASADDEAALIPAPGFGAVEIDEERRRGCPPGVRLDLGGVGKGLAADLVARARRPRRPHRTRRYGRRPAAPGANRRRPVGGTFP